MKLQWDTAEECIRDITSRSHSQRWVTVDGKIYVMSETGDEGIVGWYVGANDTRLTEQLTEMGILNGVRFDNRRAIQAVLEPLFDQVQWRWRKMPGFECRLARDMYIAGIAGHWKLKVLRSAQHIFSAEHTSKTFKTRRQLIEYVYETIEASSATDKSYTDGDRAFGRY